MSEDSASDLTLQTDDDDIPWWEDAEHCQGLRAIILDNGLRTVNWGQLRSTGLTAKRRRALYYGICC